MKTLLKKGERGQAIVILALAMIGLLGIVGLALDGGMLYWNQRRAQNGADAAAVAGTTALVDAVITKGYACGTVSESAILAQVQKYATNNEVPNGQVEAYYLTKDSSGNRRVLNNGSGPWQVGSTGTIPCQTIVGLLVKAHYPQRTFIAGIIGIAQTNVTVDAYAVYEYRNWCTDFAMFGVDNSSDIKCDQCDWVRFQDHQWRHSQQRRAAFIWQQHLPGERTPGRVWDRCINECWQLYRRARWGGRWCKLYRQLSPG